MREKLKELLKNLSTIQKERLEFVELLAYFHGTVGREEIMNRFGISSASATNLLSKYSQMAPENLSYNVRLKRYDIGRFFKPVFNLQIFRERIPVYTMPKLHEPIDNKGIEKIALISRAIQRKQALAIIYASASSGESSRQIVPVAFADNWLRWHLRAYDRSRDCYDDFVLGRILEVSPIENDIIQKHEHPKNDKQWHLFIDLKIKPHPCNPTDIPLFTAGADVYRVRIRAAMATYFLQFWKVDCSLDADQRKRDKYKYILVNIKEVAELADLEPVFGYKGE